MPTVLLLTHSLCTVVWFSKTKESMYTKTLEIKNLKNSIPFKKSYCFAILAIHSLTRSLKSTGYLGFQEGTHTDSPRTSRFID